MPLSRSRTDWLLLVGFCGFLFFFGLAAFGLVGADEPRYAQVAREMLERRDWITPMLGGLPWLEKPILYYWQAMLAYAAFGVSDWAARLPSAVDATAMVFAVYLFLRKFRPGVHLDGALMVASTAGVVGFSRAASVDMSLASTFTIALLAWYSWRESGNKIYLAAAQVFLGLATLAKGPVALFLAFVVVAFFSAATFDRKILWRSLWLPGVLLLMATALPWYVAVQVKNPEFFRTFILEHNLARFGTNLYHHTQPFWYYVPIVLVALVPWTVLAMAQFSATLRAWWQQRKAPATEDHFPIFLVIWLVVPVVLFSISRSKLPGYILPALPAGTLLLAEYVRRSAKSERRPGLWLVILHAVVASAPVVPALMIQYILYQRRMPWGAALAISGGFGIFLAIAIVVTLARQSDLRLLRFVTLVPVVLAVAAILRIGAPALDATLSARPLAREIKRMESGTLPIAVMAVPRETEFGLHFYRNQKVARYELGQIPDSDHVLVIPQGAERQVREAVPDRRISFLGNYEPQHLEFFWVSQPGVGKH